MIMCTVTYDDGSTIMQEFEDSRDARRHGRGNSNVKRITHEVTLASAIHHVAVFHRPSAWDYDRPVEERVIDYTSEGDDPISVNNVSNERTDDDEAW